MLAHQVAPAPGSIPDNLDPFRRVEQCYPQIAPRIHALLMLPPLDAATALVDLAVSTLHSLPAAALPVVRSEIERAKNYNG
ncbi:MAG: hypothetical protein IPO91_20880 [Chloroflexi bacterium]|nr:hypothetical protein [Chloroflexota bacterium]